MPPALVGPLALHASPPVSYPGAVSPDFGGGTPGSISFFFSFSFFFFSFFIIGLFLLNSHELWGETTRRRGNAD